MEAAACVSSNLNFLDVLLWDRIDRFYSHWLLIDYSTTALMNPPRSTCFFIIQRDPPYPAIVRHSRGMDRI
jgi:hypothetical protein